MSRRIFLFAISLCFYHGLTAQNPSFEEVISLRSAGSLAISPDGQHLAFTVNTTDWKNNRYDSEIWLSKNGQEPFPLTRTEGGSSSAPQWSPDGQWIAFVAKRGEHSQLYAIRAAGGEATPITMVDRPIGQFEWSPSGKQLAFTLSEKEDAEDKKREERFGKFAEDDREYKLNWLYLIDFDPNRKAPEELPCYDAKDSSAQAWKCLKWPEPQALIDSVPYTITNFGWSPDGRRIAVQHQPNPMINSSVDADLSILEVGSRKLSPLVSNPSGDYLVDWSPDGGSILYFSDEADRESNFYKNNRLFRIPAGGGSAQRLAADFDEDLSAIRWTARGILLAASMRTEAHLYLLDPNTGKVTRWQAGFLQVFGASITPKGDRIAFQGTNGDKLAEVFLSAVDKPKPTKLTHFNQQIEAWKVADSQVIQWKSQDGATIEGVLHRPKDYDASRRYPLLVVIHGGPTGIDRPTPLPGGVYPIVQWLNKGALVLRVNYRGSAGYGEAFRSLNVRNLGVGDAWDVLSGVDFLVQKGMVDTTRMGCMGWSQGGYISAFLTTTSKRFKAISVGAGISDWMTYYVNTDIHPFTRQYLKATPWEDPEIYAKTSPMTYINQAATPTLIQHGEFDQRVPIPNAYQLHQGLQDRGIPSKLIVYKGFGHGINKPRERLAAVWHNWQWFLKYIWGEEVTLP